MEEWEVENELVGKDLPNFKEDLKQAIFLTKFTAITAKKILLVAKEKNIDAEELFNGIGEWIENLKGGKDANEKI